MKKSKIWLVLLFLTALMLFATPAFATEAGIKHPIDIELEKKIDADSSTYGMMEAARWAEGEWGKLLDKNYQALMKSLSKKEQAKLKAAQSRWEKHRDAEFDFNGTFWSGFEGTAYPVFAVSFRSDFVRERALQLGRYLDDLNEFSEN